MNKPSESPSFPSSRPAVMTYRRSGKSGLKLPSLSLGFWQGGFHLQNRSLARALVREAFDLGICHFDLASNYGPRPGEAEEVFGDILFKDLATHRDEILIATKAGYPAWSGPYGSGASKKHLVASLDRSLRRLCVDYVDIFYSHVPDPDVPLEETAETLADILRSGKALYIGLSKYNAEQTRQIAKFLRRQNISITILQTRYSMLYRGAEHLFRDSLIDLDIGLAAFSPLAQGLLTERYLNDIPVDSRIKKGEFLSSEDLTPKLMEALELLGELARKRGQTLAQLVISWTLRDERITTAIVGASRPEQLRENCGALSSPAFTLEELEEIDKILTPFGKAGSKRNQD